MNKLPGLLVSLLLATGCAHDPTPSNKPPDDCAAGEQLVCRDYKPTRLGKPRTERKYCSCQQSPKLK